MTPEQKIIKNIWRTRRCWTRFGLWQEILSRLANNFQLLLPEPDGRRFSRRRLPSVQQESSQAVKAGQRAAGKF